MSTIKVDTIQNTSGVEVFTAKAWVNFNGTGTVAIRSSGNVSSITDNGTGQYGISITSAISDANYSVTIGGARLDSTQNASGMGFSKSHTRTTSSLQALTGDSGTGNADHVYVDLAVTL